jgi:hypothetical protein
VVVTVGAATVATPIDELIKAGAVPVGVLNVPNDRPAFNRGFKSKLVDELLIIVQRITA